MLDGIESTREGGVCTVVADTEVVSAAGDVSGDGSAGIPIEGGDYSSGVESSSVTDSSIAGVSGVSTRYTFSDTDTGEDDATGSVSTSSSSHCFFLSSDISFVVNVLF